MTAVRAPRMELVTLRGGPLDGLPRHVHRIRTEARFLSQYTSRRYLYRRDQDGVWRHVEEQA